MNNQDVNLQEVASDMARLINYKLHAQILDIPVFVGFQEKQPNDSQTILLATKDEITEQLVSDGYIEKDDFENRIELVINNTKEWMKSNGFSNVNDSFMYYKDYSNGIFDFKIYFQNMIRMNDSKKYVIRNVIAYFYEPRFQDFYQFQIGEYFDYPLENFKLGEIDLDNDEAAKTLVKMMNKLLVDLKYKDSVANKLKRNDIADRIYEYKSNNSENNNYVNEFLNIVEDYISKSMFEYDDDFIFGGRKKFLYDEFNNSLNNISNQNDESIFRAISNIDEFICSNNYGTFIESTDNSKSIDGKTIALLREKNDRYSSKGYICLQEKEYIEMMVSKLKDLLKKFSVNYEG